MEAFKRFMVFTLVEYYPTGGISDCTKSFDTLEEAIKNIDNQPDWDKKRYMYEIFDRIEGVLIEI